MRAVVLFAVLCAASGCTDKAKEAEKRYEMVKRSSADADAVCAAGQAVVAAYLEAGDEEKYRFAVPSTSVECQSRRGDERYGVIRDSNGKPLSEAAVAKLMKEAGVSPP